MQFDYTSGKWLAGADSDVSGEWNAYNNYSGQGNMPTMYNTAPKNNSSGLYGEGNSWAQNAGSGAMQYNNGASTATGGAISGAMNGYQSGGGWGAAVGAIAGYYGGKENEKNNDPLKGAKYQEEIRQRMMQEQRDALSNYTADTKQPAYNFGNNLFNGQGTGGLFQPQAATQPVVNPEQNSYGLLRG